GGSVINKLVAFTLGHPFRGRGRLAWWSTGLLPGLAAIARALDDLAEPSAGLRTIQAIRVSGRSLHMIYLPAGKQGSTDVPIFAFSFRRENERTLARSNEYSYFAHSSLLPDVSAFRNISALVAHWAMNFAWLFAKSRQGR